jgi:5-methylcytosine-specific restriction endonuclease McrA
MRSTKTNRAEALFDDTSTNVAPGSSRMTALRQLLRLAAATDREAVRSPTGWQTRCLHCRTAVSISDAGEPLGSTTLEHIVPRSWFGRRGSEDLVAQLEGPSDPRNLALACARCNQQKGRGPDAAGPGDARAKEIVRTLLVRRAERYVEDSR